MTKISLDPFITVYGPYGTSPGYATEDHYNRTVARM